VETNLQLAELSFYTGISWNTFLLVKFLLQAVLRCQ